VRSCCDPWAVAFLALLLVSGPRSAVAETIRISGTWRDRDDANPREAFRKPPRGTGRYPASYGSSGSVKAVLRDAWISD